STADFPGTSPSPGRGSVSAPSAWFISTRASCSKPKRSRQMPMQAPIKQPFASKRGCAVTSVGARIVSADGRALGRDASRDGARHGERAVLVFRHAGHGRVNLVYRRANGHIGWIDPPTIENNAH